MDDIVLEATRYGKAEVRVVRVAKDGAEHSIRDLSVSISLSGDQAATHLSGDNSKVLTTDAQKNAVYSLAAEHGISSPEHFALVLARHFLATCPFISHARIAVEEYAWARISCQVNRALNWSAGSAAAASIAARPAWFSRTLSVQAASCLASRNSS